MSDRLATVHDRHVHVERENINWLLAEALQRLFAKASLASVTRPD
jgi:hypothetical protein